MADFVAKSTVKSSVRKLTAPLESMTVFQNLITDIITNNPWGCVDYHTFRTLYEYLNENYLKV